MLKLLARFCRPITKELEHKEKERRKKEIQHLMKQLYEAWKLCVIAPDNLYFVDMYVRISSRLHDLLPGRSFGRFKTGERLVEVRPGRYEYVRFFSGLKV